MRKERARRQVMGFGVVMTAIVVAALGVRSPATAAASGGTPVFGAPITLPSSTGGEPSLAVDPYTCSGTTCNVYVISPNGTAKGPAIWHSTDGGSTWSAPTQVDTVAPCNPASGGDTDVDVLPNGSVVVADLNVVWSTIQISTDHAATFPACTTTAPEDDRPWLAHMGSSTVYVAYHDFVGEVPIVCTSTTVSGTSAGTFTCVPAFGTTANPGNTGTQLTNCAENTVPARAFVVDKDGSQNFLYSCSTAAENAAHPPYGPLHDYYLARSTNGVTFTTYPVFLADTSGGKAPNYANIFGNLAEDTAGNLYALWTGTADDNKTLENPDHVYLTVSTDHGATWTKPVQVDHETTPDQNGATGEGTHTLAHLAVTTPGNVDIVWYGTTNTGEPNGQCGSTGMVVACTDNTTNPPTPDGMDYHAAGSTANTGGPVEGNWRVSMAQSTNALCNAGTSPTCSAPTFTQTLVDPNYRHFGTVCSNGIVCGGAADRHLLDFISVGIDCSGLAHVSYAADQNSATVPAETSAARADGALTTVVTNQTGGTALGAPAGCPAVAAAAASATAAVAAVTPSPFTSAPAHPFPVVALVTGLTGLLVVLGAAVGPVAWRRVRHRGRSAASGHRG